MKKVKLTSQKLKQLEADYRQHNKQMAQSNNRRLQFGTLNDYIGWRYGSKPRKRSTHTTDMTKSGIHRRVTLADTAPSLMTSMSDKSATARKNVPTYSGEEITGIATSHKSNLLPVGRGTDPKIFSTMRRGDGSSLS